jgi:sodium/bile acid cotransporter 7
MGSHLKKHSFTLLLLFAVVLAILFPGPATPGGWLHAELLTKLGVAVIFLFQGLSLPTRELARGYQPKRLHGFIISWNYLFFPLVTGLILLPVSYFLDGPFILGFWLLSILPTTVSSAVAFTAVAGGHSSKAIFSTVLSNLLAVFIVPAVAAAYLAAEADIRIPLVPLLLKLGLLIIAPLLLGQVIRSCLSKPATSLGKWAKPISNGIIIFIVHAAFAKSATSGFFQEIPWVDFALVLSVTAVLLAVVGLFVWVSGGWIRITLRERITAFFCASQKSIATGLPIASMILAAIPEPINFAAALIPLMCYHPAQLILAGFLCSRWQTQTSARNPKND